MDSWDLLNNFSRRFSNRLKSQTILGFSNSWLSQVCCNVHLAFPSQRNIWLTEKNSFRFLFIKSGLENDNLPTENAITCRKPNCYRWVLIGLIWNIKSTSAGLVFQTNWADRSTAINWSVPKHLHDLRRRDGLRRTSITWRTCHKHQYKWRNKITPLLK